MSDGDVVPNNDFNRLIKREMNEKAMRKEIMDSEMTSFCRFRIRHTFNFT